MKKEKKQFLALFLAFCMAFSLIFENPFVVEAATKIVTKYMEIALSAEEVSKDLYLQDVFTLNQDVPYVGFFTSETDYSYYYGTSNDLVNWNITSEYFSLVYGNQTFVGISSDKNYQNHLNYTTDGRTWEVATLPVGISPLSVKFENGYFKLYCKDDEGIKYLYLSQDAKTWFDITKEVPDGTNIENIIIKDGALYSLTGTNISGSGFRVHAAKTVNEGKTQWDPLEKLNKEGYGMLGNFMFDGKTVGVQLYSIAEYEKDEYVSNTLYYVTSDFVNWVEKDWTQDDYDYYSIYDATSTAKSRKTKPEGKRFEAIEIYPYRDGDQMYYVSYVVYSEDGQTWKKDAINIFVNGEKISKDPKEKNAFAIPASYEWARKGVEYSIGRNYVYTWDLENNLPESISRGDYLILIMKALNVQAPKTEVSGFVPFSDIYSWWEDGQLINRAKMLGLVNGKSDHQFDPDGRISRQDMMVMTYNILRKSGMVEADTNLTALQVFSDKDQVSGYGKEAVSSLIKAGIIAGSGNKIDPLGNLSYAEAMVIAERLNVYRTRE